VTAGTAAETKQGDSAATIIYHLLFCAGTTCSDMAFEVVFVGVMTPSAGKENRRTARIAVSKGLWVAWQADGTRHVSRVRDLSAGGVFIQTTVEVAIGKELEMLFALPEGETRVAGVVRYADGENGIGVEFTTMGSGDRLRVDQLLRRLKPK